MCFAREIPRDEISISTVQQSVIFLETADLGKALVAWTIFAVGAKSYMREFRRQT
jgi:hypothetical protein